MRRRSRRAGGEVAGVAGVAARGAEVDEGNERLMGDKVEDKMCCGMCCGSCDGVLA